MVADHIKAPICLSERTAHSVDDFCHVFYNSYQEHASSEFGMDDVPPLENVVHTVNLSTESAMAAEFDEIISTLRLHRYEPEAFVTFSEYLSWVVLRVVFMLHLFRLQETHCPFFFSAYKIRRSILMHTSTLLQTFWDKSRLFCKDAYARCGKPLCCLQHGLKQCVF